MAMGRATGRLGQDVVIAVRPWAKRQRGLSGNEARLVTRRLGERSVAWPHVSNVQSGLVNMQSLNGVCGPNMVPKLASFFFF